MSDFLYQSPPDPSGITTPDDFWGSVATQFILSSGTFPNPNDLTGEDIVIRDMMALKTFTCSNSNLSTVTMVNCPAMEFIQVSGNPLFLNGPDLHLLPLLTEVNMSQNASMVNPPDVTGLTALTILDVSNNPLMTSWPALSGLSSLSTLTLIVDDAMTTGPDASGLTTLETFECYLNAGMATGPDVSGDTALGLLDCHDNSAMATAPDMTGCISTSGPIAINLSGCALPESEVDSLLAQLDANGNASGTLDLSGGTNAPPSSAGYASAANLVNKLWVVILNGSPQVLTNAQKLALTGLSGGEEVYVADAFVVSAAGDGALNGMYRQTGSSGGKPRYNLVGSGSSTSTNVIKWVVDKWLIAASTGTGNNYESTDVVAYPWLVTTWTVGGVGTGPAPTVDTHPVHQTYDGGGESDEGNWTTVP